MREAKSQKVVLSILLCILVFTYIGIYVFSNNIHDDGLVNTLVAKEIATRGEVLTHRPYHIMDVNDQGDVRYLPIPYPQTSQITMALFYLIGAETLLKFFSPLLGILTAIFVYLLLKEISKPIAALSALFAVVINTDRFIMTPLMEQPLLAIAIISIYFYYKLLKTRQNRYILLTALFLGLCISIKQQGLIILGIILIHGFFKIAYDYVKQRDMRLLKIFSIVVIISAIVAFIPLFEQVERNGTLDYVPGDSAIPFFESKFPGDPEAISLHDEIIGYWPSYNSLLEVLEIYSLYPISYSSTLADAIIAIPLLCLTAILSVFAFMYLHKRDKLLLSILVLILLGEVIVNYLANTPVGQYHVVGLAVWAMFLVIGLSCTRELVRPQKAIKLMASLAIFTFIVAMFISPLIIYYPPWQNSGRYDNYHLGAFEEMGCYIQNNTPKDAIFIAANEGFMYYAQRDAIWLSEGGGAKVPLIFSTNDETEALYWLRHYNISYIFIDIRQTEREGLFDYIPSSGLLDYIDKSAHFERIHSAYPGNEVLRLYKVTW